MRPSPKPTIRRVFDSRTGRFVWSVTLPPRRSAWTGALDGDPGLWVKAVVFCSDLNARERTS